MTKLGTPVVVVAELGPPGVASYIGVFISSAVAVRNDWSVVEENELSSFGT